MNPAIDRLHHLFPGAWVNVDLKDGWMIYEGRVLEVRPREYIRMTDQWGGKTTLYFGKIQEIRRYSDGGRYHGVKYLDIENARDAFGAVN